VCVEITCGCVPAATVRCCARPLGWQPAWRGGQISKVKRKGTETDRDRQRQTETERQRGKGEETERVERGREIDLGLAVQGADSLRDLFHLGHRSQYQLKVRGHVAVL
jgi:hypothetical protein